MNSYYLQGKLAVTHFFFFFFFVTNSEPCMFILSLSRSQPARAPTLLLCHHVLLLTLPLSHYKNHSSTCNTRTHTHSHTLFFCSTKSKPLISYSHYIHSFDFRYGSSSGENQPHFTITMLQPCF